MSLKNLGRGLRARGRGTRSEINLAPLIDMIFILLIFFMVTATFLRENTLDIEKPSASSGSESPAESIRILLASDGSIRMNERPMGIHAVRPMVRRALASSPTLPVVIVADEKSRTEDLIAVYDRCRLAGASRVAVATTETKP